MNKKIKKVKNIIDRIWQYMYNTSCTVVEKTAVPNGEISKWS